MTNPQTIDKTQTHIEKLNHLKINQPGSSNHNKIKKNFIETLQQFFGTQQINEEKHYIHKKLYTYKHIPNAESGLSK